MDWLDDNKSNLGVLAIALTLGATQIPQVTARFQRDQAIARTNQAAMLHNQDLQTKQMLAEQEAAIAEDRYTKGCELLVSTRNLKQASPIRRGWPVILSAHAKTYKNGANLTTIKPEHTLPAGVTVCDAYGGTALMVDSPERPFAVADKLASTSNREFMRKALDSRKGIQRPAVSN